MQYPSPDLQNRNNILDLMRSEWDARARENADFFVQSERQEWNERAFLESGRSNISHEILSDMLNICQRRLPLEMTALEIGCGSGRMSGSLAKVFGRVHAVDISKEMLKRAKRRHFWNWRVRFHQTSGDNLSFLKDHSIDFAFSMIVFQHVPSKEVVENYIREVSRVLKPGCLFKFQVQGYVDPRDAKLPDTWEGVSFTEEEMRALAAKYSFECRYAHGAGTQYFWLWFFKPEANSAVADSR